MHHVVLYSKPDSPPCTIAQQFFVDNDVEFEEKDISLDDAARKNMVERTGQTSVPVIEIDGAMIVGFNKVNLSRLLGLVM
jgi:glutaredoxin